MSAIYNPPQHSYLIVGAFYRQRDGVCPAKALLTVLPAGTNLILRPEPDNEHDPNAIAVGIDLHQLAYEIGKSDGLRNSIISALADCGWTTDRLLEEPERPLGYIPAVVAAQLSLSKDTPATLAFDLKGAAKATW